MPLRKAVGKPDEEWIHWPSAPALQWARTLAGSKDTEMKFSGPNCLPSSPHRRHFGQVTWEEC